MTQKGRKLTLASLEKKIEKQEEVLSRNKAKYEAEKAELLRLIKLRDGMDSERTPGTMKKRKVVVIRISLELNISGANMDTLKKYGKVKEGITREVLVPADINLHALHYVIQRAFGWRNSHLHHFLLPDQVFSKLTQNNFSRWADYCGIYFRFPTSDYKDLYWDDDYDESVSERTWLRKKYTGPYQYRGNSEHFMAARKAISDFIAENETMRVSPSFSEWMNMSEAQREDLRDHPRIKNIEDMTCEELREIFAEEGGPDELLERLKITEVLGEEAKKDKLKALITDANKRFEKNNAMAGSEYEYQQKMNRLNGAALPLTKELIYEYDYGDGWEVKIKLVDEYYRSDDAGGCSDEEEYGIVTTVIDEQALMCKNGKVPEDKLRDQITAVITEQRPLCIALDGLPVLDDVGGIYGYCEMLTGIYGKGSANFDCENSEEIVDWAREQGWTGRMNRPENLY